MANQWFKFYGAEYLSDPKIYNLTAEERSCWLTLLCLASTSTDEGRVEFLSNDSLLRMSGVNMITNDNTVDVINKFQSLKMITVEVGGSVQITNWNKRQERVLTGYERVKRYRENKKKLGDDNANDNADNGNDNIRIEENRIEENRIDNTQVAIAPVSPSKKFIKPTVKEIKEYCDERENGIDPQQFFDYYQSNGWKVGKNSMKDWKASVRTWERNGYSKTTSSQGNGKAVNLDDPAQVEKLFSKK